MPKHQEYYQRMIDQNMDIFARFQDIHDNYVLEPKKWQANYNEIGDQVINIIRDWERKLCRDSERGQFSKFSANLAEKFWELVRKDFPKIDFVGVK
ncbi:MAG: hypothetical protein V1858_01985 [Candidatus Gottesmanbacteria bacterium]